ncbi:MAG TPA: tetratricopeptide repeat protein [Polyangia bacterium]|nr:tetratricopeptide repeat protein [Polyangia bacterium]
MSKNISKKELKQPDQFVSFWTRFSDKAGKFLTERRKPVLIGIGGLAGVVTATVIYGELHERSAMQASQALSHVERVATADLIPADGTAPPKEDGLPHFKTDKERLEAALKEVDAFMTANPRNPLRREAELQKAGLLLDLQRPDEAIPLYSEILGSRLDRNLRFLPQEGLGYAYEAKGDLDQAAAAFAKLGEGDSVQGDSKGGEGAGKLPFYRDRSLYHQGRIAERKGNPAQAVKLYKEVLEKAPQSPLRDEITNRLAVLESK